MLDSWDAGRLDEFLVLNSILLGRDLCYTCISVEVTMLAIRLPQEIENRLADLAAKTGRTKTFYAREAILEFLDEMEDRYLAIDRLENRGKRWTLDELEQDLDLVR